jgi:hypothetical protein
MLMAVTQQQQRERYGLCSRGTLRPRGDGLGGGGRCVAPQWLLRVWTPGAANKGD